jgi:hypothetical protein
MPIQEIPEYLPDFFVIASVAKQSIFRRKFKERWIASTAAPRNDDFG